MFEAGPNAVILPKPLKNVLTLMGYANVGALSKFTKDEFQEIESFMQKDLIDLIDKKDVELYYGIYKNKTESYRLLGGHKLSLLALAEKAGKIAHDPFAKRSVGRPQSAPSSSRAGPSSDSSGADPVKQKFSEIDEHTHLNSIVCKWMKENNLCVGEFDEPNLKIEVVADGLGSFRATLDCPKCDSQRILSTSKFGNKWNTSPWYKHLRKHIPKATQNESVRTITQMFTTKKNSSTSNGQKRKRSDDANSAEEDDVDAVEDNVPNTSKNP